MCGDEEGFRLLSDDEVAALPLDERLEYLGKAIHRLGEKLEQIHLELERLDKAKGGLRP